MVHFIEWIIQRITESIAECFFLHINQWMTVIGGKSKKTTIENCSFYNRNDCKVYYFWKEMQIQILFLIKVKKTIPFDYCYNCLSNNFFLYILWMSWKSNLNVKCQKKRRRRKLPHQMGPTCMFQPQRRTSNNNRKKK